MSIGGVCPGWVSLWGSVTETFLHGPTKVNIYVFFLGLVCHPREESLNLLAVRCQPACHGLGVPWDNPSHTDLKSVILCV